MFYTCRRAGWLKGLADKIKNISIGSSFRDEKCSPCYLKTKILGNQTFDLKYVKIYL